MFGANTPRPPRSSTSAVEHSAPTATMAVPLLVTFVAVRQRTDPVHAGLAGAALGAAAGVAAGTLVDLWCPVGFVPHVLRGRSCRSWSWPRLVHWPATDSSGRSDADDFECQFAEHRGEALWFWRHALRQRTG